MTIDGKEKVVESTLYGSRSSNVCAYCKLHKQHMTAKQLKRKACLNKQCHHLERIEHEYWEQRERMKALRKEKKRKKEML